jgi:outer membrane protein assembly factor BamE (lipoprotein component of BamABCDE complex)
MLLRIATILSATSILLSSCDTPSRTFDNPSDPSSANIPPSSTAPAKTSSSPGSATETVEPTPTPINALPSAIAPHNCDAEAQSLVPVSTDEVAYGDTKMTVREKLGVPTSVDLSKSPHKWMYSSLNSNTCTSSTPACAACEVRFTDDKVVSIANCLPNKFRIPSFGTVSCDTTYSQRSGSSPTHIANGMDKYMLHALVGKPNTTSDIQPANQTWYYKSLTRVAITSGSGCSIEINASGRVSRFGESCDLTRINYISFITSDTGKAAPLIQPDRVNKSISVSDAVKAWGQPDSISLAFWSETKLYWRSHSISASSYSSCFLGFSTAGLLSTFSPECRLDQIVIESF